MANRIFDLQETKGSFQVKGKINGTQKEKFFVSKKTKTNNDFRAVNFGCEYNDKTTVYLSLSGMPQDFVYFSARDKKTKKTVTDKVSWENRFNEPKPNYRMIGVNLGLTKITDKDGNEVNDKKVLHPYDACAYINENMEDGSSVFVRGNIEFNSFYDNENNLIRRLNYVPNQISLCKNIDFSEYNDDDNKPIHNFTQKIIFMDIEKEIKDEAETGRFIVDAKLVSYSDIMDVSFIITNKKLSTMFKKHLKPYTAIEVFGCIEVSHDIEEVMEDDGWGGTNPMKRVSSPSVTELIITGADPSTIDKETYNEKNVSEAIEKIKNAKMADKEFGSKKSDNSSEDAWGEINDADDEDDPWA